VKTQALLDVLRDCRDEGLWLEAAKVVEEIDCDAEYDRFSCRRVMPKPDFRDPTDYDPEEDPDEYFDPPPSFDQQRREYIDRVKAIDFLAWQKHHERLTNFDAVLREYYSSEGITSGAAMRESPFYRMMTGSRPDTLLMNPNTYELLVRRYTDVQATMPGFNAVVNIGGTEMNVTADPDCPRDKAYVIPFATDLFRTPKLDGDE
jgi:hypothetical protein